MNSTRYKMGFGPRWTCKIPPSKMRWCPYRIRKICSSPPGGSTRPTGNLLPRQCTLQTTTPRRKPSRSVPQCLGGHPLVQGQRDPKITPRLVAPRQKSPAASMNSSRGREATDTYPREPIGTDRVGIRSQYTADVLPWDWPESLQNNW